MTLHIPKRLDMILITAHKSGGVPRNNSNDHPILWGAFVPTKPASAVLACGFLRF